MPSIEIRPANDADLNTIIDLDHSYHSDHVWQMDLQYEERQLNVRFREVRLPRAVRVDYPRSPQALLDKWSQHSGMLVAVLDGEPVGYIRLVSGIFPHTMLVTDLAVTKSLRRKGIGSALLLAAQDWARSQRLTRRLMVEMQPKNYPAISLAQKLGYDFCGYNDHYFENQDIAIYFAKWLR
jgi:GNAT superfamily N-acetyltransferase